MPSTPNHPDVQHLFGVHMQVFVRCELRWHQWRVGVLADLETNELMSAFGPLHVIVTIGGRKKEQS